MSDLTPQQIVADARTWLGTPYRDQGYHKGVACDCLGLVRGVYEAVTGQAVGYVPRYTNDWKSLKQGEQMYAGASQYLTELPLPSIRRGELPEIIQEGDVLLFRMMASVPAKHAGIVAKGQDGWTLIHAMNQKSVRHSAVQEVNLDAGWVNRIAYAFRFKEVM